MSAIAEADKLGNPPPYDEPDGIKKSWYVRKASALIGLWLWAETMSSSSPRRLSSARAKETLCRILRPRTSRTTSAGDRTARPAARERGGALHRFEPSTCVLVVLGVTVVDMLKINLQKSLGWLETKLMFSLIYSFVVLKLERTIWSLGKLHFWFDLHPNLDPNGTPPCSLNYLGWELNGLAKTARKS